MTKKERVAAAFARKPVDRATYNFRAEPDTLEKIYQYLGFSDYDRLLDLLNVDMVLNPDFCHTMSNIFTKFYEEDCRRAQIASGGRITIFNLYSAIGSQKAPLISREMPREFVLPYIRHELGGALFFHSCGMIYPFIGELADSGIDILDPIQPYAPEMLPDSLARTYGDRVCFHGGIDVQKLLVEGSIQDVRDTAKRYQSCFAECGYICSSTHLLQSDACVENMPAIFDEVRTPV